MIPKYDNPPPETQHPHCAGAQRVALRTSAGVKYLLGDHLGSTAVTAYANGAFDTETRYYPWGGVRWSYGAPPTDYQFTGQQKDSYINLYWYGSRWYDQSLGRFIQPDTIVPEAAQGVQAWDRFAYVNNNPLIYTDPDGHFAFLVPILAGSVIGGVISTIAYAATATATGHDVTIAGAAGTFIGGAVAGIVSVIATPVAGTLLHAAGVAASGTALVAGTATVNAVGGALSYLAAGGTQNAVDLSLGNSPTFQPTLGGALYNAGVAGILSPVVGSTFPVATNTMSTISQASHFMPGRTVTTLLATENARNMYRQTLVATGLGMFAGLHYEEPE